MLFVKASGAGILFVILMFEVCVQVLLTGLIRAPLAAMIAKYCALQCDDLTDLEEAIA